MKEKENLYTYKIDMIGNVILYKKIDGNETVYLQGDDATMFLRDMEETEKVWDKSTEFLRGVLKSNFKDIDGHISYIISEYFLN